jgi:RNA methyltransferase, TrmH family
MGEPLKPLAWYKDLQSSRIRRELGFFLIEGRRAVEQVVSIAPLSIEEILVTEAASAAAGTFPRPVRILTDRQFKAICASKTPQGIAAVVRIPEGAYEAALPPSAGSRVLLLERVQDPGNVGTLIRTAAAFDYDGVVLSEECADPFSSKAIQATAGSVMALWIRRTGGYLDLTEELKRQGFSLVAADLSGDALAVKASASPHVLALGSEGAGLSDRLLALSDRKIRIPMNSRKAESLNVAVSGAILMFSLIGRWTVDRRF